MNREILFRGKRADNKGWVYGYYSKTDLGVFINQYRVDYDDECTYCEDFEVIPESIGQFIGRLDKYDNKIFEGCRCKLCINDMFNIYEEGIVEFFNDRYILRIDDQLYTNFMFIDSNNIEIIPDEEETDAKQNEGN